jgi:hypothetical protein
MSQAKKSNTMSPLSRRSALAGLSVAAVAGTVALPARAIEAGAADRLDPAAALGRAEFMIERLRTRYVCEGWHGQGLDEDAAARVLAYFRNWSAGGPDDADEWMFVVRFLGDHGQSIDWIVRGDPGGMICEGASRSSRASVGDPIFAVIAEHRAAVEAHMRALYDEDRPLDTDDALWEVLTTQPTTLPGVAALLHHVGQLEFMEFDKDDPHWTADGETVLSVLSHNGDECDFAHAAREFPTRLAATVRSLIEGQS